MNIQIDFAAGTHGHYLSFVMNKLLLGDKIVQDTPFTKIGTSHGFSDNDMPFTCGHWSMPVKKESWHKGGRPDQLGANVLMITVQDTDILPVTQLAFLRSADRNCDPSKLEHDTYFKLSGHQIGWGMQTIDELNIHYKNVDCNNAENTYSIDEWEIALLEDNKNMFVIDEQNPDCPRNILRDYFKKIFYFFIMGQMTGLRKCFNRYRADTPMLNGKKAYWLQYQSFYNTKQFLAEIDKIKEFFNLEFHPFDLENLHSQFLDKQPYKNSVETVNNILEHIRNNKEMQIPQLDVLQESYINARLQQIYKTKLPIGSIGFPRSVTELVKQYGLNK